MEFPSEASSPVKQPNEEKPDRDSFVQPESAVISSGHAFKKVDTPLDQNEKKEQRTLDKVSDVAPDTEKRPVEGDVPPIRKPALLDPKTVEPPQPEGVKSALPEALKVSKTIGDRKNIAIPLKQARPCIVSAELKKNKVQNRFALHEAICNGNIEDFKAVLSVGKNLLNVRDFDGRTPLMLAVDLAKPEMAVLLLKAKANPNIVDRNGETPLHVVATTGDLPLTKLLLESGADPNIEDNEGYLPLFAACVEDHPEIAKLLLDFGADPDKKTKLGGLVDISCLNGSPAMINALMEKGISFSPRILSDSDTPYLLSLFNERLAGTPELALLEKADGDFTREYSYRKELAHRFGFEGMTNIAGDEASLEGWSVRESARTLVLKTDSYYNQLKKGMQDPTQPQWHDVKNGLMPDTQTKIAELGSEKVDQTLDEATKALRHSLDYEKETAEQLMARVDKGEVVPVLTSWIDENHCVAAVFYKDSSGTYVISRCNKGSRPDDKEPGIYCQTLHSATGLLEVFQQLKNPGWSSDYFYNGIDKALDIKDEVYIRQKDQKVGNCTVANANSMERAIQYMLFAPKMGSEAAIDLSSGFQKGRCADSRTGTLQEYLKFHTPAEAGATSSLPIDYQLLLNIYEKYTTDPQDDAERKEIIESWCQQQGIEVQYLPYHAFVSRYPTFEAVEFNDVDGVQTMTRTGQIDINSRDMLGQTPLHAACMSNRVEVMNWLIDNGADLYALDNDGISPLAHAMLSGSPQLVGELLKLQDIDFTSMNMYLGSSLHRLALQNPELAGTPELAALATAKGNSPIHSAIHNGDIGQLRNLISEGNIPLDALDSRGETPLSIAIANLGTATPNEKLKCREAVKLLLQAGADPNIITRQGVAPLHTASMTGSLGLAKVLLNARADPNLEDNAGMRPIHHAYGGNIHIIELLLQAGADPNIPDPSGSTILSIAQLEGNVEVIKLLGQ